MACVGIAKVGFRLNCWRRSLYWCDRSSCVITRMVFYMGEMLIGVLFGIGVTFLLVSWKLLVGKSCRGGFKLSVWSCIISFP